MPDLQTVQVFLPNALAARQLRRALIAHSRSALLGPPISSMPQWINNHIPLPDQPLSQINQSARQLILFTALKQHRQLFNENNLWQICNSLLQFFDELSQNSFDLNTFTEAQWQTQLQAAYGIKSDNSRDLNHLVYEARLVHTLWQAWQQQTRAMNLLDSHTAYQLRLQQPSQPYTRGMRFYVAGFDQLTKAEQQWCRQLEATQQIVYVSQTAAAPDHPCSQFIHHAMDTSQALWQHPAGKHSQAAPIPLSFFPAAGAETEARAIHMQTRCWLAENKHHIAIISENRKLMRRVRAMMERSGIVVEDTAGWSIATTSAASCLERWLQCIEQDFAWQPLLDLLKSPFFSHPEQRSEHLKNIYRLQQDIIVYERVTAGIERYKKALHHRHARLPNWHPQTHASLLRLLDTLQAASTRLHNMQRSTKDLAVDDLIAALLSSFDDLGITAQLATDAAGMIVLQAVHNMKLAATHMPCKMNWQDFRTWLAATLEQQPFTPKNKPSTVHLLNLKQAEYCEFDAVIIASANADSLPGTALQTPYFNQSVRRALGLKTWTEDKAESFQRFKHLLLAGEQILISYQVEQDGEWMQPSPWLQSMEDYAQNILGYSLRNTHLQTLLQHEELTDALAQNNIPLQTRPAPAIPASLHPQRWSVSSYQRMIDCPYRFFVADVLSLKAEDEITRELQRSEYGEKIHETLRAFFEQRPRLPAPFTHQVTAANRQQAIDHLNMLAQQVFARDIENNVQHRGWLQQWSVTTETFIDWLIDRQQDWRFDQAEISAQHKIDDTTELHGRLDLIEKNAAGLAIIDYKSGHSPNQQTVNDGENVQLTSYALLMENVKQVAFLKLDKKKTTFSAQVSDAELETLTAMNLTRLQNLSRDLQAGQGLPAWGDSNTCKLCDMAGICRRQIWQAGISVESGK